MKIIDLQNLVFSHPVAEDVDQLSFSFINFKKATSEIFIFDSNGKKFFESQNKKFYDLASVTKPLTIGLIQFIDPKAIKSDLSLLLNHQSGIPAWGILSKHNWKEQIEAYPIKKSPTVYSDFGALRAQIEFEKTKGKNLYNMVQGIWSNEVLHWKNVDKEKCLETGDRQFKKIIGDVHDPNAWIIKEELAHAGLFGTIEGLTQTLLNIQDKFDLISYFLSCFETKKYDRFINAWDTVTDKVNTLAGGKCSDKTVGHLGFTGTSFWIDCEKQKGVVILSNATKKGWYQKAALNDIRRQVGNLYWTEK